MAVEIAFQPNAFQLDAFQAIEIADATVIAAFLDINPLDMETEDISPRDILVMDISPLAIE